MKTVLFASYKSGVGRTLALANLAHFLSSMGQRVVALDLDLETPGLQYKLEPKLEGGPASAGGGALDLFEAFADRRPMAVEDVLTPVKGPAAAGVGEIFLLEAGLSRGDYWRRLAAFPWRRLLTGGAPHEPTLPHIDLRAGELLLALATEIELGPRPDVLLIDAPSGPSELADLAAALLADDVVLLLAHNRESLSGTAALITALTSTPRPSDPDEPARPLRIFPVLARLPELPEAQTRALVASAEAQLGCSATGPVQPLAILHDCTSLSVHERVLLARRPEEATSSPRAERRLVTDYVQLFSQLSPAPLLERDLSNQAEAALRQAFEDPGAAARTLEGLAARMPHPTTLRALLKFRRLTRALTIDSLRLVRELVAFTGDLNEPLVRETVRACAPLVAQDPAAPAEWRSLVERLGKEP